MDFFLGREGKNIVLFEDLFPIWVVVNFSGEMFYGKQIHHDQCENPLQVLLLGGVMKGKGDAQLPQICFLILACACLWCLPVDEASRVHVLCINWLTAPMIACLFPQEFMFKIIDCLVQYFTVKYSLVLILDPPLPPRSGRGGYKFFLAKCLSRYLTEQLESSSIYGSPPFSLSSKVELPSPAYSQSHLLYRQGENSHPI